MYMWDVEKGARKWEYPASKFAPFFKSDAYIDGLKHKPEVAEFYRKQNETIVGLINVDHIHSNSHTYGSLTAEDLEKKSVRKSLRSVEREQVPLLAHQDLIQLKEGSEAEALTREEINARINLIINGAFYLNIALFFAKVFASFRSLSLSVMASTLDSLLDLLSGSIIFLAAYVVNSNKGAKKYSFPAGTSRVEPLAVLIFAAVMFTATLQLIVKSLEVIATGNSNLDVEWDTISIVGFTIISKALLFIACRTMSSESESVTALMIDARNDVLSNSFGLLMAYMGQIFEWWLDPTGAIVMGLYIMYVWATNGFELVTKLSGMTAEPSLLTQITYLAYNHHPAISEVDTVRAYHLAYNFLVEVDVVLPKDMRLEEAHDIGESLQNKIERLEDVERAWVHLDTESIHKPEHILVT